MYEREVFKEEAAKHLLTLPPMTRPIRGGDGLAAGIGAPISGNKAEEEDSSELDYRFFSFFCASFRSRDFLE